MQPSVARGWGRSQAVWGFYSKPLEKFKGARVGGGFLGPAFAFPKVRLWDSEQWTVNGLSAGSGGKVWDIPATTELPPSSQPSPETTPPHPLSQGATLSRWAGGGQLGPLTPWALRGVPRRPFQSRGVRNSDSSPACGLFRHFIAHTMGV